jgi:hypothetical protein
VDCNSAASPSQAAAAARIGPDPGPVYIRPELISGGNAAKNMSIPLAWLCAPGWCVVGWCWSSCQSSQSLLERRDHDDGGCGGVSRGYDTAE